MPVPENYDAICSEWARSQEVEAVWRELGGILGDRAEWHWEVENNIPPGPAWCFGLAGEARLVADVDRSRYHLFVYDTDEDLFFDDRSEFETWLDAHEAEHEGLSQLGRELFGHLLPGKVAEWSEEQEDEP
jgi:hypothetical protein